MSIFQNAQLEVCKFWKSEHGSPFMKRKQSKSNAVTMLQIISYYFHNINSSIFRVRNWG